MRRAAAAGVECDSRRRRRHDSRDSHLRCLFAHACWHSCRDAAFSFLVACEFMSLSSWALVLAHHRVPDNVRAGYVYIVMASFGTLALLLAFGLLAGPDGGYAFADIRASHPSAAVAALALCL